MDVKKVTEELHKRFTYVTDKNQYGKREAWYIMKPDPLAKEFPVFKGDCEDFSLTVLYQLCAGKWTKFWWYIFSYKAQIRYCYLHTPDRGHAVLQLGDVYLDNIFGTTTTKEAMEERGYVFKQPAFLWFLPTTVSIKLLLGKIWKTKSRLAE